MLSYLELSNPSIQWKIEAATHFLWMAAPNF